ncbi:MAG TPA: type IV secretion system protein [Noviherbaspirillum sp.]
MQKKYIYFSMFLGLVGVLSLLPELSFAQATTDPSGIPKSMDLFRSTAQTIAERMVAQGGKLLLMLTLLQVAWNGADRFLKGSFELKSIIGNMLRTMVTTTFFFTMLFKAPTWFLYALDQWVGLGSVVTGQTSLSPGALMVVGMDTIKALDAALASASGSSWTDIASNVAFAIQLYITELIIFIVFLILAGQLALAQIKGYLWLCVGPLLLGFGGLKTTRDVAVNTLKAVVSHGAVIVTVYVIAAIVIRMVPQWNEMVSHATTKDWTSVWGLITSMALLALAAWQVPKYANDFINGSVSGGVSEVAGAAITAAAAGAAVATGGAAAAGMAAGTMSSAGASLKGVFDAVGAGTQMARDAGKSGLGAVAGGIGHAASTGASMAAGAAKDFGKGVLDKFQDGAKSSVGGKVAEKIQSERGGAISMPGASPDVGTGDASKAALSGGEGQGGGSGGIPKKSLSEKIGDLNRHLPQGGNESVAVHGVGGGMSEGHE